MFPGFSDVRKPRKSSEKKLTKKITVHVKSQTYLNFLMPENY